MNIWTAGLAVTYSYSGIIVCITILHLSDVLQHISKGLKESAHEKWLKKCKLYSPQVGAIKGVW